MSEQLPMRCDDLNCQSADPRTECHCRCRGRAHGRPNVVLARSGLGPGSVIYYRHVLTRDPAEGSWLWREIQRLAALGRRVRGRVVSFDPAFGVYVEGR